MGHGHLWACQFTTPPKEYQRIRRALSREVFKVLSWMPPLHVGVKSALISCLESSCCGLTFFFRCMYLSVCTADGMLLPRVVRRWQYPKLQQHRGSREPFGPQASRGALQDRGGGHHAQYSHRAQVGGWENQDPKHGLSTCACLVQDRFIRRTYHTQASLRAS